MDVKYGYGIWLWNMDIKARSPPHAALRPLARIGRGGGGGGGGGGVGGGGRKTGKGREPHDQPHDQSHHQSDHQSHHQSHHQHALRLHNCQGYLFCSLSLPLSLILSSSNPPSLPLSLTLSQRILTSFWRRTNNVISNMRITALPNKL